MGSVNIVDRSVTLTSSPLSGLNAIAIVIEYGRSPESSDHSKAGSLTKRSRTTTNPPSGSG